MAWEGVSLEWVDLGRISDSARRIAQKRREEVARSDRAQVSPEQCLAVLAQQGVDFSKQTVILQKLTERRALEQTQIGWRGDLGRLVSQSFVSGASGAFDPSQALARKSEESTARALEDSQKQLVLVGDSVGDSSPAVSSALSLQFSAPIEADEKIAEPLPAIVEQYTHCVSSLAEDLIKGMHPSIADRFAAVRLSSSDLEEKEMLGLKHDDVVVTWRLISDLVGEDINSLEFFRFNFSDQFQENNHSAAGDRLSQTLIDNSIAWLSRVFETRIDSAIRGGSKHYGLPVLTDKIKLYVKRKLRNYDGDVSFRFNTSEPFWATLFYAMKIGHKSAVLDILRQASRAPDLVQLHSVFQDLREFIEISHDDSNILRQEFFENSKNQEIFLNLHERCRRHVLDSNDLFEIASYLSMGLCLPLDNLRFFSNELNRQLFSEFIQGTMDDYLWFRLKMVRVFPITPWMRESLGRTLEAFSLSRLHMILDRFSQSIEKDRYPLRYFRMLLLTQQFDSAVSMVRDSEWREVGLHFVLILDAFGLLSHGSSQKLYSDLLQDFLRRYLSRNPRIAIPYSELLRCAHIRCPNNLERIGDLLVDYIQELEDQDFDSALNTIKLQHFPRVLHQAALAFQRKGYWEKATHLYMHYLEGPEALESVCSILLKEFRSIIVDIANVAERAVLSSQRDQRRAVQQILESKPRISQNVEKVLQRYSSSSFSRIPSYASLLCLWNLKDFFLAVLARDFDHALDIVTYTENVLPSLTDPRRQEDVLVSELRRKNVDDVLAEVYPRIIRIVNTILGSRINMYLDVRVMIVYTDVDRILIKFENLKTRLHFSMSSWKAGHFRKTKVYPKISLTSPTILTAMGSSGPKTVAEISAASKT